MKITKLKILLIILFIFFIIPNKIVLAEIENEKIEIENKINDFRNKIIEAQGKIDKILYEVKIVENEIKLFILKIDELNKEKNILIEEIKQKETEIKKMTNKFNKKKQNVYNLARQAYEEGDINYIYIIFESKNLTEFINNREYYLIIRNKELDKINEIKKEREKINNEIKILKNNKKEFEQNEKEIQKQKEQLEIDYQKLNGSKDIIEEAKNELKRQLEVEEEALMNINSRLQGIINNSGDFFYSGNGRFVWPTRGYISSDYGEPREGGSPHKGIDFAANSGTPIVAVDSGEVLISEFIYDGFGAKVIINHGSGLISLYGHMSSFVVHTGQHVFQGQVIGYVGSTGDSTGSHLHLQVTNNGDIYRGNIDPKIYFQ